MINARAESVTEKPAYRKAFEDHRCLIIADSFYEWKKTRKEKIHYIIQLKNKEVFAFAGIYDRWKHKNEEIISCSIITTDANKKLKPIHDRMPVILEKNEESDYLENAEKAKQLLNPYQKELKLYQISNLINSPKNESKEVIKPIKTLNIFK